LLSIVFTVERVEPVDEFMIFVIFDVQLYFNSSNLQYLHYNRWNKMYLKHFTFLKPQSFQCTFSIAFIHGKFETEKVQNFRGKKVWSLSVIFSAKSKSANELSARFALLLHFRILIPAWFLKNLLNQQKQGKEAQESAPLMYY